MTEYENDSTDEEDLIFKKYLGKLKKRIKIWKTLQFAKVKIHVAEMLALTLGKLSQYGCHNWHKTCANILKPDSVMVSLHRASATRLQYRSK